MPYYFGEGDPGWDELLAEDESEYRPPNVSQFRYLTPPALGGAPQPVRFSDRIPPPPAHPLPEPASATAPRPTREQRQEERLRWSQRWLALVVVALREIGARRVYCRYDGGNDEGFTWLDRAELSSGERLAPDEVAKRLAATKLRERLATAGLWHDRWGTGEKAMRDTALATLATECAVLLLGRGYGTGPFWFYGAFTVDLDACTIVDDRNADPIVSHIGIEA